MLKIHSCFVEYGESDISREWHDVMNHAIMKDVTDIAEKAWATITEKAPKMTIDVLAQRRFRVATTIKTPFYPCGAVVRLEIFEDEALTVGMVGLILTGLSGNENIFLKDFHQSVTDQRWQVPLPAYEIESRPLSYVVAWKLIPGFTYPGLAQIGRKFMSSITAGLIRSSK